MRPDAAMNPHERFEELAALELIGELSAEEYRELHAHLKACHSCQREYRSLEGVLSHKLPLLHERQSILSLALRGDTLEELSSPTGVSRATNDWQLLSQSHRDLSPKNVPFRSHAIATSSLAAAAILTISFALFSFEMREQSKEAQRQVAALKHTVSLLNTELQNRPHFVAVNKPETKQANESVPEPEDQSTRLVQHAQDLEQQLNASAAEISQLRNQLESTELSDSALARRVRDAQEQLERTSADLQAALRDRDETAVNLKNKETELLALEQEVADLRDSVDRDRALLAATHDITNLMGARNLRIVDVSDVDGKGKTRKAFGRVFFTEGKSLVFYAFDLPDSRSVAHPASFQAWGAQGANLPGAKSLGIFFHDDRNNNRWVLKFDDPTILSEIDSVFVTVEPLGGSKKPTGTPLLPAYLRAELNHP